MRSFNVGYCPVKCSVSSVGCSVKDVKGGDDEGDSVLSFSFANLRPGPARPSGSLYGDVNAGWGHHLPSHLHPSCCLLGSQHPNCARTQSQHLNSVQQAPTTCSHSNPGLSLPRSQNLVTGT